MTMLAHINSHGNGTDAHPVVSMTIVLIIVVAMFWGLFSKLKNNDKK